MAHVVGSDRRDDSRRFASAIHLRAVLDGGECWTVVHGDLPPARIPAALQSAGLPLPPSASLDAGAGTAADQRAADEQSPPAPDVPSLLADTVAQLAFETKWLASNGVEELLWEAELIKMEPSELKKKCVSRHCQSTPTPPSHLLPPLSPPPLHPPLPPASLFFSAFTSIPWCVQVDPHSLDITILSQKGPLGLNSRSASAVVDAVKRAAADGQRGPADDPGADADGQRGPADDPRADADGQRGPADDPRADADGQRGPADDPRADADCQRTATNEPRATADGQRATVDAPALTRTAGAQPRLICPPGYTLRSVVFQEEGGLQPIAPSAPTGPPPDEPGPEPEPPGDPPSFAPDVNNPQSVETAIRAYRNTLNDHLRRQLRYEDDKRAYDEAAARHRDYHAQLTTYTTRLANYTSDIAAWRIADCRALSILLATIPSSLKRELSPTSSSHL
ncbi:unnamed protein product [Closterium sp. NIES-65]|nr:unnamed protein product [Closterium sp. NIES-65]